jgi:hypothetical protein
MDAKQSTLLTQIFVPIDPIDPCLKFPVKLRAVDGTTIALEHTRVEAQSANLFAVPPSYRRLDPQALIERIKHSDVWADSPH